MDNGQTNSLKKFWNPCTAVLFISAIWLLLHAFTLNWGMPAQEEPVPDCIPIMLTASVNDTMEGSVYNYPPLQYLLTVGFSKQYTRDELSQTHLTQEELARIGSSKISHGEQIQLTAARIVSYRIVTAFMQLFTVLAIFFILYSLLNLSLEAAAAGALMFLLTPVSLFYSLTTNMDIPYTFWFILSIAACLWAIKKEQENKSSHAVILNLLCGALIACSFCTKDQVYALYILPALFLVIHRWYEKRNALYAVKPLLLWGVSFVLTVFLIYAATGNGKEIFMNHFSWITTNGIKDFSQHENTVLGHIKLLFQHFIEWIRILDIPVLLLIAGLLFGAKEYKEEKAEGYFTKKEILAFLVSGLFFLSLDLFFTQIILFSYPRFLLPVFATTLPGLLILWDRLKTKSPILKYLPLLVLILQVVIACQVLYNLVNFPTVQARELVRNEFAGNDLVICTGTAKDGTRFAFRDGELITQKTVRNWNRTLNFYPKIVHDLYISDLEIMLLEPNVIILPSDKTSNDVLLSMGAVPLQELKNNSTFFTSLYPFEFQTIQLYAVPEETVELLKSLPIFRSIPLAAQIKYLSHAAIATGVLINSPEKLFLIGDALQPFENPESLAEFHISQIGIINTAFAYYTTKRYKDLYAAMEYILENFADGEGIVRNMMSVMDLSDAEIEFQNDAGTENQNPETEPSESASDVNAEESPEAA